MASAEFLIVGARLAGTALAWALHRRGRTFVLIDAEPAVTSTRIAAGADDATRRVKELGTGVERLKQLLAEVMLDILALRGRVGVEYGARHRYHPPGPLHKYAGRGWPVFPLYEPAGTGCSCRNPACDRVGKHPRTSNGLKAATTNPETIRRWWANWPDAGVGIVTGPASGFWMLGPDGPAGLSDLKTLEAEHGALPVTARIRSGSGGEHLYFRWPTDGKPIPNRKNRRGLKSVGIRGMGLGDLNSAEYPSVCSVQGTEWATE